MRDLRVAQDQVLGALYAAAARGFPTLADSGYEGAGRGVYTPVKKPSDGHALHINTAPTTSYFGQYDASANADSPC
jgi:hypothetical protein